MKTNNENVYVVPGHNYFSCTVCGIDRCNVAVPVPLDLFHSLRFGGEVKAEGRGHKCGRQQIITLRRPDPPALLKQSEISEIVERLAERLGIRR